MPTQPEKSTKPASPDPMDPAELDQSDWAEAMTKVPAEKFVEFVDALKALPPVGADKQPNA
jgi:hypothetical protein